MNENERIVNTQHMVKQAKKKDLSDGLVYATKNGVTEMFPLSSLYLKGFDKTLAEVLKDAKDENKKLNERIDKAKDTITGLLKKLEVIEGKLKKYGLE